MKICADHWQTMRDEIERRGLSGLIAKSGKAAIDNMVSQIEDAKLTGVMSEKTTKDTFDPLMSMYWHFTNNALRCGGLYLLGQREDGGEYCPICEFVSHQDGFVAKDQISEVADQMRVYCIEEGLIARPS